MKINSEILVDIHNKVGPYQITQINEFVYLLRFGYWDRIETQDVENIIPEYLEIVEESDYDDDVGSLFMYLLQLKNYG